MKDDFISSFDQALDARDESRFADMLKHAEEMVEAEPGHSLGYQVRGEAQLELEHLAEALEDFNRAIELKPANYDVYLLRGTVLTQFTRYKEAHDDLNLYIEKSPEKAVGYTCRGVNYFYQKRSKECIADLEKSMALDPDNDTIPYYMGISYGRLQNYEQAILWLDKAAPDMPDDKLLFTVRGTAHFFLGHWKRCADDMSRLIYLDAHDARPYFLRSQAKFEMNDTKGSEQDFKKLKKMAPEVAKALTQNDLKTFSKLFADL